MIRAGKELPPRRSMPARLREGRDSALYDDQTARRTVIDFACAALVPESASAGAEPHTERPAAGPSNARRASPPGNTPNSAPKEHHSWA